MAKDKKSFLLYTDLISVVSELSDEEAGLLFKHMLMYVNDMNPTPPNRIIKLIFEPIKLQLKRDLSEWNNIRKKRSESGKLGGLQSGRSRNLSKQNEANEANASNTKQNEANEAVNVNVNDNVINEENTTNVVKKNFHRDYIEDDYREPFIEFLEYKKARRESYKSEKSEKLAYSKLKNLANNNPSIARQIVEQSMANNYAGLFELKTNFNGKSSTNYGKVDPDIAKQQRQSAVAEHIARKLGGDDQGEIR